MWRSLTWRIIPFTPRDIKGVIPIAGAYDIVNYYNVFLNSETNSSLAETHVKAVYGDTEAGLIQASPTEYVDDLSVPMLLISENRTYNYAKILEDKIRETDFREFHFLHMHRMEHGDLWRHLSYDDKSMYRDFMIDFIQTNQ